jgi:hypothetical protein
MSPRVLISIPNTLSTRNLLRTDVFSRVKADADRVILVTPFADDPDFRAEFVRGNVVAYRLTPYRPEVVERALFSVLYNLYLSGDIPETLHILLNRWADNHPGAGRLRRMATRNLLPPARRLAPLVEAMFMRLGSDEYADLLTREKPDVAVFSRLFFCDEIPLMRAASRAGVPTVGAVASWDNLTNKGPLVPRVDRLIVWNDLMQAEAIRFHGYSAADVVVAGAAHHDLVFARAGFQTSRTDFCARLGLDPEKKLITYAGEDPIIAPDTPAYIEQIHRFIEDRRLSRPAQLLVRPHPQDDPRRFDRVRRLPGVAFDLPGRPTDHWMDMSRDDLHRLYETLHHSDVVVNVTSTIVVDAAFVDTPSVCIAYGDSYPATFYNHPARFFEMNHYRYIMDAKAARVVTSESELCDALNTYLEQPSLDSGGRHQLARQIAQFEDGRSGERIASAIIAAALTERAHAAGHSTVPAAARERAI